MNIYTRAFLMGMQWGLLIELARRSPFCRRVIVGTLAGLIVHELTR